MSYLPISLGNHANLRAIEKKKNQPAAFDYLDEVIDLSTNGSVNSIAWTQKSDSICCCTGSRISFINTNNIGFDSHISKFRKPSTAVSYRDDGKLLVAADESGLVQVFSTELKTVLKRFYQLETPIYSVFFQDFTHVAACGRSGKLYIWDISSGDITFACQAHTDSIRAACKINETTVCTTSYDGYIKFWDISTGVVENINEDAASTTFISYKRNLQKAREISGTSKATPIIELSVKAPIDSCTYDEETGALFIAADKRTYCLDVFGKLLTASKEEEKEEEEKVENENEEFNKEEEDESKEKKEEKKEIIKTKSFELEEVITAKSPIILKGITSLTIAKVSGINENNKDNKENILNTMSEKCIIAGCADGTVRALSLTTLMQLNTICRLPSAVVSVAAIDIKTNNNVLMNNSIKKPSLFCGLITNKLIIICPHDVKDSVVTEDKINDLISNRQKLQDALKERITASLSKNANEPNAQPTTSGNSSVQMILDKALEKLGEDSVELRRAKNSVMGQLVRLPRLDIDFVVTNDKPKSIEKDLATKLSSYSSSFPQGLQDRLIMINKYLKKFDYSSALEYACKKPIKSTDGSNSNKLGSLLIFLTLLQELESRGNRTMQIAISRLSSNGLKYLYKYVGYLIGTEHAAIGIKAARFAIDVTTIGGIDSGKVMMQLHQLTKTLRDELEIIQGLGEIEGMIEVLNF